MSQQKRANCATCGKSYALTWYGQMRQHRTENPAFWTQDELGRRSRWCRGGIQRGEPAGKKVT